MNKLVNILLGTVLLIVSAPVFLLISIILYLSQGRPIFYKGERLGKIGKKFNIYKFRTMVVDAESQLHGKVVSFKSDLKTPFGKFLRASRLDELPQLFNLIKGDMVLFGPRPVRESVYATMADYPGYHERLKYVPGLFGPIQVLLPHTAPKKMRFRFFRRFYQGENLTRKHLAIFMSTVVALLKKTIKLVCSQLSLRVRKDVKERRKDFRSSGCGAALYFLEESGEREYIGCIQDANSDTLSVVSVRDLEIGSSGPVIINIYSPSKGIPRWRATHCSVKVLRKSDRADHCYILEYVPKNEYNRYSIDRFLLKRTIC